MNTPTLPGDRFFARIRQLDLECPFCGTVYVIGPSEKRLRFSERSRRRQTAQEKAQIREIAWDDILQRFHCRVCNQSAALGVVAWPLRNGAKLRQGQDQVPSPRQAQAIREQAGGFLVRTRKGGDDPRNLVVTRACTCEPDTRTSHPSCPVHGADGTNPTGPHLPATPPKQEYGTAGHRPRRHDQDYDERP